MNKRINVLMYPGLFTALLFTFAGCKKQHILKTLPADKYPSSLSVIAVNKKDINKFVVTFKIKADSISTYDNYGLVISKDSIKDLEGQRIYSFGNLENKTETIDSCTIDSLSSYTVYHLKVFAKKGNTLFLSNDKTISVDGLKIIRLGSTAMQYPFASRGEYFEIYTNFNDETVGRKETHVKIGGIKANVILDINNIVTVLIPGNISSGKKSIEIERNGLSVITSDTLDILRGTFTPLNDFPFEYRSHFGSCQIGATGYMVGGSIYASSGPVGWYNDILAYDISNDHWSATSFTPYPKDFIIQHEIFTVNNKIYSIPGRDTTTYTSELPSTKKVYEFDPSTNQWTEKSPFPGIKRVDLEGFVLNNKIYIFGGNAGGPLTDLWSYDPATDVWTKKADFPGTSVILSAIFTYKNKAYIFGGFFPQTLVTNEFWEYDPANNSWRRLPTNDDIHERFRSIAFTLGNKGYLVGGTYKTYGAYGLEEYELNDSWEYNFDSKTWSRISNYTAPALPYGFTSFYAKSAVFIKDNSAIIYDRGKMIKFTPN